MDSISKDSSAIPSFGSFISSKHQLPTEVSRDNQTNNTDNSLNPSLTNLSELSQLAESSQLDIREDAIRRATSLLNDPDLLSDKNLDSLASKITQLENF
jgi:ribosome assembly protein YihI (activator of Der GTPase)